MRGDNRGDRDGLLQPPFLSSRRITDGRAPTV